MKNVIIMITMMDMVMTWKKNVTTCNSTPDIYPIRIGGKIKKINLWDKLSSYFT